LTAATTPSRSFDAIVIGAGAAGMLGALSAAHHGARVQLLEKDLAGPSNLLVSGGLFAGAGTRWQKEAGIEDGAAAFARDIRARGGDSVNEKIVDVVAARSADAVHFLADVAGIPVHLMKITAPGHGVPRMHATPAESGRELHAMLRAAVLRMPGIEVVDKSDVRDLDRNGAAVLLATGGFAGNRELLAEFIPEVADARHIGAGPNDGRAIAWGRSLGAAVAQMSGYQGQGHVNPGTGTRLGMSLPSLGAILVNRDGKRFASADVNPSALAALVLAQPGGVALEVFDQRIHDIALRGGPYREALAAGAVVQGLPAGFEERSFPELGRPMYSSWVTGALAHTQGGLAVNANAQVIRPDGSAIEGLYAAGGAAAGLAGRGGDGYLPGNGFAQCFALGLIAGEQIASLSRRA
jgi:fumarate reductase flavoprotein subunit